MKNILMLALLLFSPLAFAQMTMPDTTATTLMLMNAATSNTSHPNVTSTKPPASTPTEEYVTDEVTMPDGSKAFLKRKKNAPSVVKAPVSYDRPSRIEKSENKGNIYVYPINVKGTACIVVSTQEYVYGGATPAITMSCNWK